MSWQSLGGLLSPWASPLPLSYPATEMSVSIYNFDYILFYKCLVTYSMRNLRVANNIISSEEEEKFQLFISLYIFHKT